MYWQQISARAVHVIFPAHHGDAHARRRCRCSLHSSDARSCPAGHHTDLHACIDPHAETDPCSHASLSTVEIAELLRANDDRSRAIFGFFLGTGCREQEVAYMTWSDVDLERNIVRIDEPTTRQPNQQTVADFVLVHRSGKDLWQSPTAIQ